MISYMPKRMIEINKNQNMVKKEQTKKKHKKEII